MGQKGYGKWTKQIKEGGARSVSEQIQQKKKKKKKRGRTS